MDKFSQARTLPRPVKELCKNVNLNSIINYVAIRLTLHDNSFNVIALYIPPNKSAHDYDFVFESIKSQAHTYLQIILVLCDFNAPYYVKYNIRVLSLLSFAIYFDNKQINNIKNHNGVKFDLIFTNIVYTSYHSPISLVIEDNYHSALSIVISLLYTNIPQLKNNNFSPAYTKPKFNFTKGDFPRIYSEIAA